MSSPAKSVRQLIFSVQLSKGRMEALTDGIFAIAMTLLVLELKVPELAKGVGSRELLHNLGRQIPSFFSFFGSFLYCGMMDPASSGDALCPSCESRHGLAKPGIFDDVFGI